MESPSPGLDAVGPGTGPGQTEGSESMERTGTVFRPARNDIQMFKPSRPQAHPMAETTIGTIETLLEGAIEETEDSEISFKLRSALQLLFVIEEQHVAAREAIEEAEIDDEIREDLRELGYID